MENYKLLCMPIFGVKTNKDGKYKIAINSVINYGKVDKCNNITYLTNAGIITKRLNDLDHGIKHFDLKDIDLNHFLYKWCKFNNESKPIILDYNIKSNEVYSSGFSVMIERRKNEIAIKPIFD